jgi:hypothetical protein
MYKNRVSDGKNVPVSTWEFPLFWRDIFQREASFGSLFVTVHWLVKLPMLGWLFSGIPALLLRVYTFQPPEVWMWGLISFPVNSVDLRVYPFLSPAGCGGKGVSLSTVNRVYVRVYLFPSPVGCGCIGLPRFPQQQCKSKDVSHHQHCGERRSMVLSLSRVISVDVRVYPCLQSTVWT